MGLLLYDPFQDSAHAGRAPEGFDGKLYRMTAILTVSLLNIKRDVLFVDVSHWQGNINFLTLKAAGIKGVIIKCGQGIAIDSRFRENWQKAQAAGLWVGCYWFYDSRIEPKRQAATWANELKPIGLGQLPCFGDYEEKYGGAYAGILYFTTFMLEFQKLTGLRDDQLGVYTGYFYWQDHGINDSFWSRYWLWIAWYGSELDVIVPKPWTQEQVWGWQFTDQGDGKLLGAESAELDLNYFIKGLDVFEQWYGETGDVTPPPDTGVSGMYRVWSELYAMSLRKTASILGEKVESYARYTDFICDQINVPPVSGGLLGDRWAHVIKVGGVEKDLWVAQIHNGGLYCKSELISSGAIPRVSFTFTDKDGTVYGVDDVELIQK